MEWVRIQITSEENGEEQWRQFVAWLDTPPGGAVPSAVTAPAAPTRAEQMRADAEAAVGSPGAAFDAFMAARG